LYNPRQISDFLDYLKFVVCFCSALGFGILSGCFSGALGFGIFAWLFVVSIFSILALTSWTLVLGCPFFPF
jgi:hypothetical protein